MTSQQRQTRTKRLSVPFPATSWSGSNSGANKGKFILASIEVVMAQASIRNMHADEMVSMIIAVARTLQMLSCTPQEAASCIRHSHITCLECGKHFKLLTRKHLNSHGITATEYKKKWGLPQDIKLVSHQFSKQRSRITKALMAINNKK